MIEPVFVNSNSSPVCVLCTGEYWTLLIAMGLGPDIGREDRR